MMLLDAKVQIKVLMKAIFSSYFLGFCQKRTNFVAYMKVKVQFNVI